MAGARTLFHLAAMVSVPQGVAEPLACHDICATGTLRVLLAAQSAGVRRVVYAASSSAYGNAAEGPLAEDQPIQPLSPYAAAKLAGEHYCTALAATSSLETVRLRFFNVFGPRQDPSSPYSGVIARFVDALTQQRRPTIFGDGLQSRDFVYVGDVVQALMKAATTPSVSGRVFNIGRGERVTLLELLAALTRVLDLRVDPIFEAQRAGDVRHSQANIAAARRDLAFDPKMSLVEGLRICLEGTGPVHRPR